MHLVLTAHPTEARRRAVVAALRRISELLSVLGRPAGRARPSRPRRRAALREHVDLLWRTSQLRVKAMDPIDEVRTVMTAFDETLFRVVPAVYRELDRALGRPEATEPGAGPRLPALRQLGGRRPGRQPVRDRAGHPGDRGHPGRPRAARAGERHRPDRPGADPARGDHAARPPGLRRALAAASAAHPELLAEIAARVAAGAVPDLPAVRRAAASATRARHADLAYPGPAEFLADLRLVQESLAAAGAARQAFGELQNLIWQAETFGFHLAGPGGPAAQRGARPGAARTAGRRPPGTEPGLDETGAALVGGDRGSPGHVPGHRPGSRTGSASTRADATW